MLGLTPPYSPYSLLAEASLSTGSAMVTQSSAEEDQLALERPYPVLKALTTTQVVSNSALRPLRA